MTIKEMLNRVIEILTDKHTTRFYVELPKINTEALRKRIIEILDNKRGEFGGGNIPDDEIEALANVILPGVIKFFSTEEGRAEFEAWKKERDLMAAKKEDDKKVS